MLNRFFLFLLRSLAKSEERGKNSNAQFAKENYPRSIKAKDINLIIVYFLKMSIVDREGGTLNKPFFFGENAKVFNYSRTNALIGSFQTPLIEVNI